MRRALPALVVAAFAAGCGGGGHPTATAPPPPKVPASSNAFDDCLRPGPGVAMVKVRAPGEQLPAVVLGHGGSVGVVFANESGNVACGWLPYARDIAGRGVQSLLFDYALANNEDEVLAAADWLRAHGAKRVVIVGASIGGRAVVTAGAKAHSGQIDAIVSLSGERILGGQRDIIVDARRLRAPTLWVSSTGDGYTNFAAETRQLYRAARGHARPDRLLVVGGDDHGWDLLKGPQAHRVVPAVTGFIRGR
jgi:pimeloyl-ACP methyl ester carboxylesterase